MLMLHSLIPRNAAVTPHIFDRPPIFASRIRPMLAKCFPVSSVLASRIRVLPAVFAALGRSFLGAPLQRWMRTIRDVISGERRRAGFSPVQRLVLHGELAGAPLILLAGIVFRV